MSEIARRRGDLDVARAIAAFMVVLNHIPQYFVRHGLVYFNAKLAFAIQAVTFYVNFPVFMLVAGIVLGMRPKDIRTLDGYAKFEAKKFCRLIIPFLAVSLMTLAIKIVTPGGGGTAGIPHALLNTLIAPRGGGAPHLWFLYTLMGIFLIWPLFGRIASGRSFPVLLLGMFILGVLPIWPRDPEGHPLFALQDIAWNLPIFALGYWLGQRPIGERGFRPKAFAIAAAVAVAAILVHLLPSWPDGFAAAATVMGVRLIGSIAASLCVLWLCGIVATWNNRVSASLETVGFYSYDIYLLHVALVGHPLVFAISKLHPGPVATYVLFVVAAVVTMIVPIGIGRLIRRVPPLAFVMLGVPMPVRPAPPQILSGAGAE